MNEKTSISLRFNTDQYYNVSPALAENTYTTMDTPNSVLDVQHTFSPTMLNDARIGQNRDNYQDTGDGKSLYSLSITGFTSYALGDHSYRKDNSYSFVDNFTYTKGRHTSRRAWRSGACRKISFTPNHCRASLISARLPFSTTSWMRIAYSPLPIETQARKNPYYGYILENSRSVRISR